MAIDFGKLTQIRNREVDSRRNADSAARAGSTEAASIFTDSVSAEDIKERLSEDDREELLRTVPQMYQTNSDDTLPTEEVLLGIIESALAESTEPKTKTDDDTQDYIPRADLDLIGDENDNFGDYLKDQGINIESATNTELTEALNTYNDMIAQKDEFTELYKLFADTPELQGLLDDTFKLTDTDTFFSFLGVNTKNQTLENLYEWVSDTGAFKTEGERGTGAYNNDFKERVASATEQMISIVADGDYSDELKAQVAEISARYAADSDVTVGQRTPGDIVINETIDERVKQSGTGDCYLLATLNCLQETQGGREIIEQAIVNNGDGSYTVNLPGVGMSYTFGTEEIAAAELAKVKEIADDGSVVGSTSDLYSNGDDDAMLIEMAIEKFRAGVLDGSIPLNSEWPDYATYTTSQEKVDQGKSPLTGGFMSQVLYLLSGIQTSSVNDTSGDIHKTLDLMMENPGDYVLYAGISASNGYSENSDGEYYLDPDDNKYKSVTDSTPESYPRYDFTGGGTNTNGIQLTGTNADGNTDNITITNNSAGNHAISIVGVSEDTVTIINPWDSDKTITVSREEFENYMYQVQYARVDSYEES